MSERQAKIGRWLRFASVGLAATGVHAFFLVSLVEALEVPAIWANLLGFVIAFAVSYFGHFYFTFKSQQSHRRTLPGYAISAVIGAGLNVGIFGIVIHGLGAPYWVAFACVIAMVPIVTYSLAKGLVFGDRARRCSVNTRIRTSGKMVPRR